MFKEIQVIVNLQMLLNVVIQQHSVFGRLEKAF